MKYQVRVGLVVVDAPVIIVIHKIVHLPFPLATVDIPESGIYFDPSIVPIEAILVDEALFDAVVTVWSVAAGRTPPLRGPT